MRDQRQNMCKIPRLTPAFYAMFAECGGGRILRFRLRKGYDVVWAIAITWTIGPLFAYTIYLSAALGWGLGDAVLVGIISMLASWSVIKVSDNTEVVLNFNEGTVKIRRGSLGVQRNVVGKINEAYIEIHELLSRFSTTGSVRHAFVATLHLESQQFPMAVTRTAADAESYVANLPELARDLYRGFGPTVVDGGPVVSAVVRVVSSRHRRSDQ
jgi:hypothetical protein